MPSYGRCPSITSDPRFLYASTKLLGAEIGGTHDAGFFALLFDAG